MDPQLIQAGVFRSGIQQLNTVVVPRLGVNDQQRTNRERGVHRACHVQNPIVPVGVLHRQFVSPGTAVRVGATVHVHLNISRKLAQRQLACQAVQCRADFIAPSQLEEWPVGQCIGLGVSGDHHLVGQSLQVGVRDFSRPVVGGVRHPWQSHGTNQKHAKALPNGRERFLGQHHGKTKVLVATFDTTL